MTAMSRWVGWRFAGPPPPQPAAQAATTAREVMLGRRATAM
jgi:hypothetical protein